MVNFPCGGGVRVRSSFFSRAISMQVCIANLRSLQEHALLGGLVLHAALCKTQSSGYRSGAFHRGHGNITLIWRCRSVSVSDLCSDFHLILQVKNELRCIMIL